MGSSAPMSADAAARVAAETAMGRLPPRLRAWLAWLLSRWPGRILLRSAATCIRIEVFDRSVIIAAQFFTSVFPILILFATWVGAAPAAAPPQAVAAPSGRDDAGLVLAFVQDTCGRPASPGEHRLIEQALTALRIPEAAA